MTPRLKEGQSAGTILLADISGYTSFLDDVRLAHQDDAFADNQVPPAYALMSALLDGIANKVDPPFTLVKFEGDAVFAVGVDETIPKGDEMMECLEACYADFEDRLAGASEDWTCTCNACSRKESLDLKFVIHHGDIYVQRIGSGIEVLGPDVNIAHRLLKNEAEAQVGSTAYALFTDAATDALDLPLSQIEPFSEDLAGLESVSVRAVSLAGAS